MAGRIPPLAGLLKLIPLILLIFTGAFLDPPDIKTPAPDRPGREALKCNDGC